MVGPRFSFLGENESVGAEECLGVRHAQTVGDANYLFGLFLGSPLDQLPLAPTTFSYQSISNFTPV